MTSVGCLLFESIRQKNDMRDGIRSAGILLGSVIKLRNDSEGSAFCQ